MQHYIRRWLILYFFLINHTAYAAPPSSATPQPTSQPTTAPVSTTTSPATPPQNTFPTLPKLGYNDGFFLQSLDERFSLVLRGVLQTRLTWTHETKNTQNADQLGVFIRRARINLHGNAFTKSLRFRVQVSFDRGFSSLKDFYLDYTFVKSWVRLRVGQFKRPFSRQFLTSGRHLEFVGRSVLHDFFWIDRDIGAMLHGQGQLLDWYLGVFNGTTSDAHYLCEVDITPSQTSGKITDCEVTHRPAFVKPAVVARVNFHTADFRGYREGDNTGGKLRAAVGLGTYIEWDADRDGSAGIQAELDYHIKAYGFATTGSFYLSSRQQKSFLEQQLYALGGMVQASYFFAKIYQLAGRYAFTLPQAAATTTIPQHEFSAVLGVFLYGHNFKWQNEFSVLLLDIQGQQTTYYRVRSQLQLSL